MTDIAIETHDLIRIYGNEHAVDGINLSVKKGEIYGFLGPNGAGKSTTVKMLCTLQEPTSGWAKVAGYDVVKSSLQVRLRIGVALQDSAVDPKLTGRETLHLQARYYGLHTQERRIRIEKVLSLVDIGDAIDRRVGSYSGGMKRRLDLAAALVHNPDVLFLDEPTTGLDPISRIRVWDEVRRLNEEHGMTIFLTTQYLEEADQLADRVGIIATGKIIAEGTPEELKRRISSDVIVVQFIKNIDQDLSTLTDGIMGIPGVSHVTHADEELTISVGSGAETLSPIAVYLDQRGVEVRDLALRRPTLDDVFLQLTGEHNENFVAS